MIWLDGLDLPMVGALDVIFAEHAASEQYGITKPDDVSTRLYHVPGLRPVNAPEAKHSSPLLNYKWARPRRPWRLPDAAATPCWRMLLVYANPYTGGPVCPPWAVLPSSCAPAATRRPINTPVAVSTW